MNSCKVCSGRGLVTLAVRPDPTAMTDPAESAFPNGHHENFPCPACSPSAPAERVGFVTTESRILIEHEAVHPDYVNRVKLRMAGDIGRHLLEGGYITFTERVEDPAPEFGRHPHKILDGKVGVVTAGQVATMEERAAIHQERVAVEVVNEAIRLIENWGSYHGWQEIRKDDARREIHKALQNVLDKRAAK